MFRRRQGCFRLGSLVASQLGSLSANQYGLYALYQGSGTFNTTGAGIDFNFTPGGSLRVFADPSANTVIVQPGSGANAFTTSGSADDILIASGMPTSGQGQLDPNLSTSGTAGINCGSFGAASTFNLTANGGRYFVAPNPFYSISFQSGQFDPKPTIAILSNRR